MTPWTGACQALLSMGIPRQEYWSGLPFSSRAKLLCNLIKFSFCTGGFHCLTVQPFILGQKKKVGKLFFRIQTMFLCSQVILLVKVVWFFHFSKAASQNLLWKAHLSLEIGRAASWARAAGQVSSLSLVAIEFLWQVLEPFRIRARRGSFAHQTPYLEQRPGCPPDSA